MPTNGLGEGDTPMLQVSHENVTKCERLREREESTYGHISHLMSRKIKCFANRVAQLSQVKTRQTSTRIKRILMSKL